jgi:HAD superfamily hydrolase (TIGR01509 family)
VLFDIDGTLVDSNYLHVHAWVRAFHDIGVPTDSWRIHRAIGMDGAKLLETLAPELDAAGHSRLKDLHSGYYHELIPLLKPLSGALDLLRRVAELGLQIVLATSAPEDELAHLRGVLDSDEIVSAVTSSDDVDTAKPEPDIVHIALQRAGVPADRAVFVGDSVWDAKASARAGVVSIGVLSGGSSRDELQSAGARWIFDDPVQLMAHIDRTPIGDLL